MKNFTEFVKSINESTFESDDEVAIYDGNDGLTHIRKRKDGTYYGCNDKFDFNATDLADLKWKLNNWGYHCISGELKESDKLTEPDKLLNESK
jgi:hypothetical protein